MEIAWRPSSIDVIHPLWKGVGHEQATTRVFSSQHRRRSEFLRAEASRLAKLVQRPTRRCNLPAMAPTILPVTTAVTTGAAAEADASNIVACVMTLD